MQSGGKDAHSRRQHSLLAGFLDVISCGFAAVLVLGIILSIIKASPVRRSREENDSRLVVFRARVPVGCSVVLKPKIDYKRTDGTLGKVDISVGPDLAYQVTGEAPPFEVEFTGFSVELNRLLQPMDPTKLTPGAAAQDQETRSQVWMMQFRHVPPGYTITPNVVVASWKPASEFKSGVIVQRFVYPNAPSEDSLSLLVGGKTEFSAVASLE